MSDTTNEKSVSTLAIADKRPHKPGGWDFDSWIWSVGGGTKLVNFSSVNFSKRGISMEAQSIATQLNASGFLRTQGLIGGKWTDSYDGKTIKNLKKAKNQVNEVNFFSKYQASYALFLLQRYNNNNGSFISLLRLQQGTVKRVIFFPGGAKGEGWLCIVEELHHILYDLPVHQRENHWRIRRTVQNSGTHSVQAKATIRENSNREKEIEPGKVNSKRSYGVREPTSDDWGHIVVCTRENLWDNWGDIQNSLSNFINNLVKLTPFQPDKALFYCEDEELAKLISKKKMMIIPGSFKIILLGWVTRRPGVE
ncbi:hypothetical protein LguiB_035823 [Lonicera macranthoides]